MSFVGILELLMGLEPMTSSLPRKCSTTELQQLVDKRVKGIEPSYSAWKAAALPLSYTRPLSSTSLVRKEDLPAFLFKN